MKVSPAPGLSIRRAIGNSRAVESVLRTGAVFSVSRGFRNPPPIKPVSGKQRQWAKFGAKGLPAALPATA